jgi:hypothetical protein
MNRLVRGEDSTWLGMACMVFGNPFQSGHRVRGDGRTNTRLHALTCPCADAYCDHGTGRLRQWQQRTDPNFAKNSQLTPF